MGVDVDIWACLYLRIVSLQAMTHQEPWSQNTILHGRESRPLGEVFDFSSGVREPRTSYTKNKGFKG